MKKILLILIAVYSLSSLQANDVTKMAKIDILLKKINAQTIVTRTYFKVNNVLNVMGKTFKVKPSEKEIIGKFEKRLQNLLDKKATWPQMKKPLRQIYAKHFSEQEITDIISFYDTPAGKKLLKETTQITVEVVKLSDSFMKKILPDVQKITKQFQTELVQYRKTHK